ncbi:MAG: hypothetical protein JKY23_05900 [Nitrospinaceae bacterium]|nr:hypothetical protein [Nitrospinaceae bacterium]
MNKAGCCYAWIAALPLVVRDDVRRGSLVSQNGVEDGPAAHEAINERANKVPNSLFDIVEGHPTPPLITR